MRVARMRLRVAAGLLVLVTLMAACTDEPRRGPASRTGSPTTAQVVRILYQTDLRNGAPYDGGADLWMYDYPADAVSRLTKDEGRNYEVMPRFHDERVTFITGALKEIVERDPASQDQGTVLRTSGAFLAYAWHGDEVAYIEVNYNTNSTHYLKVFDTASGEKTTLKRLGTPLGRGTGAGDVLSLAWSKDGERLLVTDTHLDELPTVRIIERRGGSDAISPIKAASNALWSADERSIYLRLEGTTTKPAGWTRIDLEDGSRHPLRLDESGHHASLSPDGKSLAATVYDRAKDTYGVDVLDLAAGTSRRIVTGAVDAVWLGGDSFVATQIDLCSTSRTCDGEEPYHGRGAAIYRLDGTRMKSTLVSTFWDLTGRNNTDVRYS
jgi:hypothetical protein